ncbi:hypothetical protein GCM10008983_14840 [Lentibacillus halophilus]|uniref:DUF3021 domain-containing protein n=1 Tax=Lentibacillus halophilus TaxID=295065 RepID=A0ABN0Z9D8_9BACI
MTINILSKVMIGFGFGGIYIFIYMTILQLAGALPSSELWWATLACLLIGLYFGLSSLIYDNDDWSLLKRTVTHFFLSLVVFYTIALSTGWIPLMTGAVLLSLIIFVVIYAGMWLGHMLYYKKVIDDMNNRIN